MAAPLPTTVGDKTRRSAAKQSGRRSRKMRQPHAASTKDLGRWKPTDDLALIIGIEQVLTNLLI